MILTFPADQRYGVDLGWVRSRPSFSFGDYYDPNNTSFGVMRVCNDDEIAAGRGFGPHPHSDMEIVTIVLKGAIQHIDNLGNKVVTSVGEVQRMTAGSGMVHAEYNASEKEDLHSLQLWFMPLERGLRPSYESCKYDADQLINALLPVVTPEGSSRTASIHQDMTIYLSRLERGQELTYEQREHRRMFVFIIEGDAVLNGIQLHRRDTVRITEQSILTIQAMEETFFMLIDLP